ncbi:MAG: GAF domain-containing protein, partial [Chloroflexi bacterium]|nr:GAF domain-containing protein [Chloroflexota bacterium]
ETAAQVSAQISTILDTDRLLQDVVDLTKERFGLYHAHIYLLSEDGSELVLTAGAGHVGRQMVSEGRRIDVQNARSIVARAARARQIITVNDVSTSPDFLPNPLLPNTRAEQAIPLIARGQLLGVLDIQSTGVDYFTQDMQSTIEVLAGQIATAISNARLYEVAERTSRHERALGSIDRKIQEAVNVDEILQTTVRELGKALRVPYTAIELQLQGEDEASQ